MKNIIRHTPHSIQSSTFSPGTPNDYEDNVDINDFIQIEEKVLPIH